MTPFRLSTCVAAAMMLAACGGGSGAVGPSGLGTADPPGILSFDGQTFQATRRGSGAFSREPALPWLDLAIGDCSPTAGVALGIKDVPFPITPGTYTVNEQDDRVTANATLAGQQWRAGSFVMNQYCGGGFGGGVLPACTPTSPGSGRIIVTSSTTARVGGSFSVTLVLPQNYQGLLINRPPPVTKLMEGTFDLSYDDGRILCD